MRWYKFVLAGDTGTGKTAQFRTFPGRKFAQLFDPAALSTLEDGDCEYEEWLPPASGLRLNTAKVIKQGEGTRLDRGREPTLYNDWATDFNEKLKGKFFDEVDSYMLDSATLLGHHCLERELWNKWGDERIAYRHAGETMVNALYALASLPCHVLLTLHTKFAEDPTTNRTEHRLTLPGGSKLFLPRLVSALWYTSTVEKEGKTRYLVMTRPQPRWPHVRTPHAFSQLPLYADVTIEEWNAPGRFGIGNMLTEGKSE